MPPDAERERGRAADTPRPATPPRASLPSTEESNPATARLDELDARGIVAAMHTADLDAWRALEPALDRIAAVVDATAAAFRRGGRLIWVGAGTSGRLGVLDASECPPTFGVDPSRVVGVIAGGDRALREAIEGAEDRVDEGVAAIAALDVAAADIVGGIAASGTTPFVRGALVEARRRGAVTVLITSNERLDDGAVLAVVDHRITLAVGPEVIAGSTRLKCGTATKMALNAISTAAMVRCGRVFGNRMVDLVATNAKLRRRSRRLVAELAGVDEERAAEYLEAAGGEVKVAILCACRGLDVATAQSALARADGVLRRALAESSAAES